MKIYLLALGSLALLATPSAAEVRPSRGYVDTPPVICYNSECKSDFSYGRSHTALRAEPVIERAPAAQHSASAWYLPRRDPTRLPLNRGAMNSLAAPYSVEASFLPASGHRAWSHALPLSQSYPRSRLSYELGLYPPSNVLLANAYCNVPTLVHGTPLCTGSKWPFYWMFLSPTENPVFAE